MCPQCVSSVPQQALLLTPLSQPKSLQAVMDAWGAKNITPCLSSKLRHDQPPGNTLQASGTQQRQTVTTA